MISISAHNLPGNKSSAMPPLTILMPTRNRGSIISYAIDSIINQDSSNWRLIIIDNASNDDTPFVCRRYSGKYECISYMRYDKYVPIYENWARGLQYVDCGYFITLSDDDHLAAQFVSQVETVIRKTSPDMLIVNRATYAPLVETSILKHKLVLDHPSKYSNLPERVNPEDIWLPYLTCETIKPRPYLNFHPSMFVYSAEYVSCLAKTYGGFYKPSAPDYFSGIISAIHAKNIVFLNSPLVCIGGLQTSPYCFSYNKFKWFGMSFSDIPLDDLPQTLHPLVKALKLFDGYPYFMPSILRQSLITLSDIKKYRPNAALKIVSALETYQDQIVHRLFSECVDSYAQCRCHGDGRDVLMSAISSFSVISAESRRKRLAWILMFIRRALGSSYISSCIFSALHNIFASRVWVPLRIQSPSYASVALSTFIRVNQL